MPHGSGNAFKQSLSRKKARDDKQRRLTEMNLGYSESKIKTEYNFPELSLDELDKMKTDIRKKMKTQNRNGRILIISLTIITVIIIIFFIITQILYV